MQLSGLRAVVVQHEAHVELGMLGPALVSEGFTLVRRFRAVQHHEDLDAALVVVLGGLMGVGDSEQHPFLLEEQAFLSERLALERPCLGICLGAQLMAAAAGAQVSKGKNGMELGVAPVRFTKEGQADAVLAPLGAKATVAHWHHDTYSAVPGATLLASTDRYSQQAFRLGNSYAFQFHPEITATDLSHWFDTCPDEVAASGKPVAELKASLGKLKAVESQWAEFAARLAHHFAKCAR